MGRLTLVVRLAARDIRRRRTEAVLLLLAIAASTATLALGLALSGVTSQPYQQTKAATKGPDLVASFVNVDQPAGTTPRKAIAAMDALAREPGVIASSGPYPAAWPVVRVHGLTAGVLAEGRDQSAAAVDQPDVVDGRWVRPGGVVVERSYAAALGVRTGDKLTLNGRPFAVVGIAVSAGNAAYPHADLVTFGGPFPSAGVGMMWLTRADASSLATRAVPLSYLLNLRLASPMHAQSFETAHGGGRFSILGLTSWQEIARQDSRTVLIEQRAFEFGSSLLGLLAVASVAVLVGGRMAEQSQRVGLLKAIGGTPKLVAAVLLAQNLILALAAAAIGLAVAWLTAPLLTNPGSGLVGTASAPALTVATAAKVIALALAIALCATVGPALRAARRSTVAALADSARRPHRTGWLVRVSSHLPIALLLGLRLAARRPRRLVLTAVGVAITVATIVTALAVHGHYQQVTGGYSVLRNPVYVRLDRVLLVLIIMLVLLASVNAIFITWATALDTRQSSALARALGASTEQVTTGLSAATAIPALAGAVAGIPAGLLLVAALSKGAGGGVPSVWSLIAVGLATSAGLGLLAFIPARASGRRWPAEILQAEAQ